MTIRDISLPISLDIPIWTGDPPLQIERLSDMAKGNQANVSEISCCVHIGTHVDAPLHVIANGIGTEQLSLDTMIGPAVVVELLDVEAITAQYLDKLSLPAETKRILFKTRNSELWRQPHHPFYPDFVALTHDAAAWITHHNIALVGVDYLSVESFYASELVVHRTLLEAGVIIIEGLNLLDVPAGIYHLICLPLKLVGCDGAPARVVLQDECPL